MTAAGAAPGGALIVDLTWLVGAGGSPLPPGVKMVVSVVPRDAASGEAGLDGGRAHAALAAGAAAAWPRLAMAPFSPDERTGVIHAFEGEYRKKLGGAMAGKIAGSGLCGSPLFLLSLLEELRLFGVFERLEAHLSACLAVRDAAGLYGRILERWEASHAAVPVRELLVAIACSRAGLHEAEARELCGAPPQREWSAFLFEAGPFLASHAALLSFFHSFLRRAVEERYGLAPGGEGRKAAHARLADFWRGQPHGPRRAHELPEAALQAGRLRGLAAAVMEPPTLALLDRAARPDLVRYWRAVGESAPTMAEICLVERFRVAALLPCLPGLQPAFTVPREHNSYAAFPESLANPDSWDGYQAWRQFALESGTLRGIDFTRGYRMAWGDGVRYSNGVICDRLFASDGRLPDGCFFPDVPVKCAQGNDNGEALTLARPLGLYEYHTWENQWANSVSYKFNPDDRPFWDKEAGKPTTGQLWERIIETVAGQVGPHHACVAALCFNLGWRLWNEWEAERGLPWLQRCAAIRLEHYPEAHVLVGRAHVVLAECLEAAGRPEEAAAAREVAERAREKQAALLLDAAAWLAAMGRLFISSGDAPASIEYLRKAVDIYNTVGSGSANEHAAAHAAALEALAEADGRGERAKHLAAALALREALLALCALGRLATGGKREDYLMRAEAIAAKALGKAHPRYADVLEAREAGEADAEKAAGLLQAAVRVKEQALGASHWELAGPLCALGRRLSALGRHAEATAAARRGQAIAERAFPGQPRAADALRTSASASRPPRSPRRRTARRSPPRGTRRTRRSRGRGSRARVVLAALADLHTKLADAWWRKHGSKPRQDFHLGQAREADPAAFTNFQKMSDRFDVYREAPAGAHALLEDPAAVARVSAHRPKAAFCGACKAGPLQINDLYSCAECPPRPGVYLCTSCFGGKPDHAEHKFVRVADVPRQVPPAPKEGMKLCTRCEAWFDPGAAAGCASHSAYFMNSRGWVCCTKQGRDAPGCRKDSHTDAARKWQQDPSYGTYTYVPA
eukprot:tig00020723_g13462.t1